LTIWSSPRTSSTTLGETTQSKIAPLGARWHDLLDAARDEVEPGASSPQRVSLSHVEHADIAEETPILMPAWIAVPGRRRHLSEGAF